MGRPWGLVAARRKSGLNIYNWPDYIADTTIAEFQQRTGIKVTYNMFDANEMPEGKLLAIK